MTTENNTIYGFCNAVYHSGPHPEGRETWFASRAARDVSLEKLRDRVMSRGLSPGAAHAGIYVISVFRDYLTDDELEEMLLDGEVSICPR